MDSYNRFLIIENAKQFLCYIFGVVKLDISLYRKLYRRDNLVNNNLTKAIYTSIIKIKVSYQSAEIRFSL